MAHLKETIRSSSLALASAYEGRKMKSDMQMIESIQANVCKQNVTRFPYEIARLVQDLTGGLLVTMSPELELEHSDVGPLIRKFLFGNDGADIDRIKVLRLTKDITLGLNAVGCLTEPMHEAGSPQAQRIQIARGKDLDTKRIYAHKFARITET